MLLPSAVISCGTAVVGEEEAPADEERSVTRNLCDAAKGESYKVSEATLREQCENSTMDVFTQCCD